MASDEIIWNVINNQFCSFKLKLPGPSTGKGGQKSTKSTFCRNEHNVSGLCNRQSCPLANSRYATVRTDVNTGRIYLYIKTVERAHMPNKWWEKIRLSKNYARALQQIDERLPYWPNYILHKVKQRLTRLTQVRIKTQRLAVEQERLGETMVSRLAPKIRQREAVRERKAEAAAKIERAIERELVERLRSGAYGDRPLNVEENVWRKVMRGLERSKEGERDVDLDEGLEVEEEREKEYEYEREGAEGEVEYVSDIGEESDEDGEGDMEDFDNWLDGNSADEGESGTDASSIEDGEEREDAEEDLEYDIAAEAAKKTTDLKRKRTNGTLSKARKKASKGPRTGIQYEYETVPPPRQREMQTNW